MNLLHVLVPPPAAFNEVAVPAAVRSPSPVRDDAVPHLPPAFSASAQWNTAHAQRMQAVQWVVGAAVMAYFAAGLAGTLGLL